MEAEVGGEVQRRAPNAALLLAKAVLRYGSSRRISSKGETTKRERSELVGSPRDHGKASANWSFHPDTLTSSLTIHINLLLTSNLNSIHKRLSQEVNLLVTACV